MSEERTQQQRQQQDSPLQTERGGTRIEDSVVSKIAGIAAQEVDGVRMGGGTSQAIGGLLSRVPGGSSGGSGGQSRGVSVEVGEVEAAIDVTLTVAYGISIPQVAEAVRRNIINRVENLVGLNVTEVNITVNDVFFPEQEQQEQQEQQQRQLEQQRQGEEEQRVR
ncbi:MAG: Asp23/Gls24 family envelope stress response protein [Actinobacteria bacterium]|nr:Asp23/Gls24 family envelope stress response protein [Actinomycetota bacterium]